MSNLVSGYDAALFDLDGVIYLGGSPVPGAADAVNELRGRDVKVGFVTNNAARPPQTVVDQLVELGVQAEVSDVVTSAQAGARMLGEQLPPDSLIYVAGSDALADEVRGVGMRVTRDWRDEPVAVIQGYDPKVEWSTLDGAAHAIQRGARWFATNTDLTRPTDLGLVPGAGAQVAVVRTSVGDAEMQEAGKPALPLMEETVRRLSAKHPIFVGDRLDTDMEGAHNAGMDSLFVFTGAHGKADLAAAPEHQRPTTIGYDVSALLAEPRVAEISGDACRVGQVSAEVQGDTVTLDSIPQDREGQLDAVWAVVTLIWGHPGVRNHPLGDLDQVP